MTTTRAGSGSTVLALWDTDSSDPRPPIDNPDRYAKVRRRAVRPRPLPQTALPPDVADWNGSDPDAWDVIYFSRGGASALEISALPRVTTTGGAVKLDNRTAPGADGARQIDRGYEPAAITIRFTAWLEEHRQQYRALLALAHPRPREHRTALEVTYPSLVLLGIRQVKVKQISNLQHGSIPGTMEWTLDCVEYAPPTPAPSRAVAGPASTGTALDTNTALPPPTDNPNDATPPSATQASP